MTSCQLLTECYSFHMARQSRKQRETEQREGLILDVARDLLVRQGYLGLRMDDIADAMEYSKGTIYLHFPNKEEIILALANQALETRLAAFAHAVTLRKQSRERLASIGAAAELFVEQFPHFFQVEQIIRIHSIWEKTTEKRRNLMRSCESRCMSIVGGVVRDAVAQGDLELPNDCSPEDIVFGLWSINIGAFTILSSSDSLLELGIKDAVAALRRNINQMLDGYGWTPNSSEVDFDALFDAVKSELMSSDVMVRP